MLSICHIITRMIVGGAQENTLYTIRRHLEKGHKVTLLTGPSDGPEGSLLERICPEGLEIVEIPDLVRNLNPLRDWRALKQLRRFFRERTFDVVHTHSSKAGILGRMAAWDAGVPFVCHTVHGQAFHPFQSWWRNKLYIAAERFAARRCHRIFAVAQAMIDQCVQAGVDAPGKYRVVFSGMELDTFTGSRRSPELRARLEIPEDAPVVGMVARLFELKGHDTMIAAAPEIIRSFPEVRFLFVGDGILRDKLEAEAERLGVRRNFVFAGLVPPGEVPDYIAQMDVLAHLSLREGLPRACVQALASAVPAVAFPLDGTPEVVFHEKTGMLVQLGEGAAAGVADAVKRLLADRELRLRLGAEGQRFVTEHFDWRLMGDILEEEYDFGVSKARG
ncbi:MAG: glycosyltransferase family 4 protein [Victivallales bacterium]|nr:glycosyltransferase family 4 protein [Victivallales bacterium]